MLERGRKRCERETLVASSTRLDWGLNPQPFGFGTMLQPTESRPGTALFLEVIVMVTFGMTRRASGVIYCFTYKLFAVIGYYKSCCYENVCHMLLNLGADYIGVLTCKFTELCSFLDACYASIKSLQQRSHLSRNLIISLA